ncbi:zinc-dependent metalloprotease, partial [Cutibacterium acnes subsp. acnes]|nr:zinc-dependent metalloprotease [Cutibacterium acnes subsp. acnes]
MNDGPQNPGQPDPEEMAEQLRRMMQQLGLPVSGDLTSFMTQLSQMFGSGSSVGFGMPGTNPSDGPVDWSHIKDMARHITASHGPDPAPGQQERTVLLDASRLAESWLDRECEFAQVNVQPACWSRAEWIEHTFSSWQSVVEPVLFSLTEAMTGLMSPGGPNDPMA